MTRPEGPLVPSPVAGRPPRRGAGRRPALAVLVALSVAPAFLLGACSLHVSKNGISGNILGHKFSGASGALPAGFPSDVAVPDSSRVLAGGGTANHWDVAFAVMGTVASGTAAYAAKLRSDGYTVSKVQSGSVTTPTGAGPAPPSTVTLTGSTFSAHDAKWMIQVASGTTSSGVNGGLKPGEFGLNITVTPA